MPQNTAQILIDPAPTEGIRRVLEVGYEKKIPRGEALDLSGVDVIRMGTTVVSGPPRSLPALVMLIKSQATNALLERKGEPTALIVTKGFRDLLIIGNQSRPSLFDLSVAKPSMLYEAVLEVDERVYLADEYQLPDVPVLQGVSGEKIQVGKTPGETRCPGIVIGKPEAHNRSA